jgi:hypothetical protein
MSTKHSRLLQLPTEIKLSIWTYVCGDKLLHVHRDVDDDRIAYRICHSQDTEEAIHKRFMKRGNYTTKNLPEYIDPWLYHSTCEPQNDNLDLRFLRVCKSIYGEAKLIPYRSNTFSFQYPAVFTFFYHTFPPQHRDKVRRLHLHMEMGAKVIIHRDSQSWQDAFLLRLIPAFRNSTHINISIVLGSTACWNAKLPKDYRGWQTQWMPAVLALKALPLKTATVMIYDDVKRCDDHYSDPQNRQIHAEGASWSNRRGRTVRQDTAECIERELLAGGPVGRETTE